MIGNARFHRRSDAQRAVDAAEVVVHEVKSNRGFQVLDLPGEGIRQTSEAAHVHPHIEIVALADRSGYMLVTWGSGIVDMRDFLLRLKEQPVNVLDNVMVSDHRNLDEVQSAPRRPRGRKP